MKLKPETRAAHRQRTQYPPHTLAPDPHQMELNLRPCPTVRRMADVCPHCHSVHLTLEERRACMAGN